MKNAKYNKNIIKNNIKDNIAGVKRNITSTSNNNITNNNINNNTAGFEASNFSPSDEFRAFWGTRIEAKWFAPRMSLLWFYLVLLFFTCLVFFLCFNLLFSQPEGDNVIDNNKDFFEQISSVNNNINN